MSSVAMSVNGAPLTAAIGLTEGIAVLHGLVIAGAGFCVGGINAGINAVCGLIYPTQIRSRATGWVQGVGRFGALAAPIIGGALLQMHVSVQGLLMAPAAAVAFGAIMWTGVFIFCFREFKGLRLSEFSIEARSAASREMPSGRTI